MRDGALSGQPRRSKYPTDSDPRNALPEPRTAHRPDYAHFPGEKFQHAVGTLFSRGAFVEIDSPNLRWSACNLLSRPSTRGGVISPEGGCKANSIACGCECQNSGALCQCPDVRNCAESGCPKPATPPADQESVCIHTSTRAEERADILVSLPKCRLTLAAAVFFAIVRARGDGVPQNRREADDSCHAEDAGGVCHVRNECGSLHSPHATPLRR